MPNAVRAVRRLAVPVLLVCLLAGIGLGVAAGSGRAAWPPARGGAPGESDLRLGDRADTLDVAAEVSPLTMSLAVGGHLIRVPYYANRPFGSIHPEVTRAIVVLHGTLRNADEYQAAVVAAGQMAGGAEATTMIITPQFLTEPDVDRFHLSNEHAFWAYMGWRKGDLSVNTVQNPRPVVISSFAVLDTILVRLVATLPNLQRIVLAGHSAGGQVANLYTATSEVHHFVEGVAGVPIRAVVSNPSCYLYFDAERWTGDAAYSFAVPDAGAIAQCPEYNDYKYGVENPNPYASIGADSLRGHYAQREVAYLLGGADTNPYDFYLDTTCPAELQGSQRLERGTVYSHYLSYLFGPEIWQRQTLAVVPGVGHDHELMFTSACGLYDLYDYGVCSAPAPASWTEVTPTLLRGEASFAASWGDADGDGRFDLYLPATDETDLLAGNLGETFSDVTPASLIDPARGMSAQWGDYDNDGRPDLYLVNWQATSRLFHNAGSGQFTDVTTGPIGLSGNCVAAAWADYDRDGDLDLYVTRTSSQGCRLFRNDAGSFADVTTASVNPGGTCRGAVWGDYDGDGDPDLFVARDGSDKLLRNDGGSFVDATPTAMEDNSNGYSAAWGDYDNDGDLDLYVVNRLSANRLYRNDGGAFTRIQSSPVNVSAAGHSAGWADYDNDGRLDLYVSNDGSANRLFHNEGGDFVEATPDPLDLGGSSYSAAWADYDNDGDLDLYVAVNNGANHLFRNDACGENHWLQLTLVGTESNVSAIGARVRILAGGQWQFRQVGGDAGYMAQNPATLSFGLGEATLLDSIVVAWPNGIIQRTGGLPPDWRMTWIESDLPMEAGADLDSRRRVQAAPNPFVDWTRLSWSPGGGRGENRSAEVVLVICDAAGRRVRRLHAAGGADPASALWDGRDEAGRRVAAGIYLVRTDAAGAVHAARIVRVR